MLHFPGWTGISHPKAYDLSFHRAHSVSKASSNSPSHHSFFPLEAWVFAELCYLKAVSPTQFNCKEGIKKSGQPPHCYRALKGFLLWGENTTLSRTLIFFPTAESGKVSVTIIKQTVFHVLLNLLPSSQETLTAIEAPKSPRLPNPSLINNCDRRDLSKGSLGSLMKWTDSSMGRIKQLSNSS